MCYYNVHILFAAVAICNKVTRNSLMGQYYALEMQAIAINQKIFTTE